MKKVIVLIICTLFFTGAYAQREVLYSVNINNFSDSDGDGHGDIKGLREKLNDLQFLGITTIVLSPVYEADANGAAIGSIEKINPDYGDFKEYRDLIQELHNRKMKLYQTINLQYVSSKNSWFTDSSKNSRSTYDGYVLYADDKNEKPVYNNNFKEELIAVNLKSNKVAAYYNKTLKYWADPDNNGVFYDGADGFVFKDVQDKPDKVEKNGNLLKEFWEPLTAMLKKINPEIQIINAAAETISFRHSLYANANGVDAFKLQEAIKTLDKAKIVIAADSTFSAIPAGKYPVLQVEDEVARLASLPRIDAEKLKVLAALNVLMGGKPVIYNGQETGSKDAAAKNIIDTAYKEQQKDKSSLWNYYKELIKIKLFPSLATGDYKYLHNGNDNVFTFLRVKTDSKTGIKDVALVVVNLSADSQVVTIEANEDLRISKLKFMFGQPAITFPKGGSSIIMPPYGVQVYSMMP